VLAVAAVVFYFMRPQEASHPQADEFVEVYVDLALLQQYGDTAIARFTEQRDSILQIHGFTDSSLLALKDELNTDPLLLARIWDEIELKLRDLKDEYSPINSPAASDTALTTDEWPQ
jgi:hypothetical protein